MQAIWYTRQVRLNRADWHADNTVCRKKTVITTCKQEFSNRKQKYTLLYKKTRINQSYVCIYI